MLQRFLFLLPQQKPVHFLGIGEIEDILMSVGYGIDSLDCVTPTRLGRMGWIFDKKKGLKNKQLRNFHILISLLRLLFLLFLAILL